MNLEKLERLRTKAQSLNSGIRELSQRRFSLREEISRLETRQRDLGAKLSPGDREKLGQLKTEMADLCSRLEATQAEWQPLAALVRHCDEFVASRRPN